MAGFVLTASYPTDCDSSCIDDVNTQDPLMFQKEISSNGNTNTVDVIYPAMPFFLYANPQLLKYVLEPLFGMQESALYPNKYAMHGMWLLTTTSPQSRSNHAHIKIFQVLKNGPRVFKRLSESLSPARLDGLCTRNKLTSADIGAHFPNATGHVEGNDEFMPIEECGDMILMAYAYYKSSGDIEFLTRHYDMLKQWAQYLVENSLTPSYQLSTDDFAGHLANQTNLAIKGILGVQAMSMINAVFGKSTAPFEATAAAHFKQWEHYAISSSGQHTLLAYEHQVCEPYHFLNWE